MFFEQESIIVVASHNSRRGQNVALPVSNGQHITRLSPFSTLVGYRFPSFLGNGMAAIQIHLCQIQLRSHLLNTCLPDPLKTSVGAPLLPVIVHRLPAWFAARCPFARTSCHRQSIPLTPRVQPIQHQIEDGPQWSLAHVASLRFTQLWLDILPELFFGYTY